MLWREQGGSQILIKLMTYMHCKLVRILGGVVEMDSVIIKIHCGCFVVLLVSLQVCQAPGMSAASRQYSGRVVKMSRCFHNNPLLWVFHDFTGPASTGMCADHIKEVDWP
jgi:hypothetical protein